MQDLMRLLRLARILVLLPMAAWILAAGTRVPAAAGEQPGVDQATPLRSGLTLPKVAEHRYRIKVNIRFLLVWLGWDNVGSARMTWYRGGGSDRGYEILLGSDPLRAPRRINRWGYVAEQIRAGVATTIGVMKPTDDASLEEAKQRLEKEQSGHIVFNMIRETASGGQAVAEVTKAFVSRDYSYRELDTLFTEFDGKSHPPDVKRTSVAADVTPGLLTTIAALMHEDADARRRGAGSRGAQGKSVRYLFNGKIYTLKLASSRFVGTHQYGGRYYTNLVQNEFEISMQGFSWKERFTIVYAMDTSGIELPVFATYQARWWFKAELLLDESQEL
jgi:hypothetical protein